MRIKIRYLAPPTSCEASCEHYLMETANIPCANVRLKRPFNSSGGAYE